jgi:hypothetical protein
MKKRFEIPLTEDDGLKEINLFAVDDFLRSMASADARRKLILTAGASRERRQAYEEKHGLPHGSVELAMLMEDKRFRELDRWLRNRLPELADKNTKPEAIEEIYRLSFSLGRGLKQLYPDAADFMLQYSVLSHRNRQRFMADFGFSNEYKLQMAEFCFPSCDGGLNCNSNINVFVTVNLAQYLIAALAAAVYLAVALVFVVCVAIPVWPA